MIFEQLILIPRFREAKVERSERACPGDFYSLGERHHTPWMIHRLLCGDGVLLPWYSQHLANGSALCEARLYPLHGLDTLRSVRPSTGACLGRFGPCSAGGRVCALIRSIGRLYPVWIVNPKAVYRLAYLRTVATSQTLLETLATDQS